MYKITSLSLWKFWFNRSSHLRENKKKHPCRTICVLSVAWVRDLSWGIEFNSNIFMRHYFFHKNYVISEWTVSHNVLYYQQLSIARYLVIVMLTIILSYQKCPVPLRLTFHLWWPLEFDVTVCGFQAMQFDFFFFQYQFELLCFYKRSLNYFFALIVSFD